MTSRTTRTLYRLAILATTLTLTHNLAPPNALAQNGDSPYFQDGDSPTPQHTPVLQEAAADAGAMIWSDGTNWVLDNMLHGFTLPSWTNPVPKNLHVATAANVTLDTLEDGSSCYYDWLSGGSQPKTIDYQFRRYSVNGDEGVLYFPTDLVGPTRRTAPLRHHRFGRSTSSSAAARRWETSTPRRYAPIK